MPSKLFLGAVGAVVLAAAGAGGYFMWRADPPAAGLPAAVAPQAPAVTASPDGIALAAADAAAVRVPSLPTAWGGPRTGQEPTLSDRVVDYAIEARLDPDKHTIDGREHLTWRNRSEVEVRAVYLHLYLNAFEGEGSTFMSEKRLRGFEFRSDVPVKDGDWGHTELKQVEQGGAKVPWQFVHPDGGPDADHTVVRLNLPVAVKPGGSTTLDIDFFDQLPRVLARTGYFGSFHLVGQWFPKIGVLELPGERGATAPRWNVHEFHLHSEFYADFGSYDVRIDVPQGYTVGATGEEVGAPALKDGRVTHRFVQGDVHDFAWTADKRTAPPLEGSYTGAGSPAVKVKVLFPPEYAHNAPAVLKATIDSLAWFSNTLGPYPYKTVTAVIPPYNATEAGGMEYPTFFTAEGYADPSPDTLSGYALDFVTIHEFGHGYFYGILASNEFEEPMLDEGLNEYWDLRMLRARGQRAHLTTGKLKRWLGLDPSADAFEAERLGAGLAEPPDALGQNSWNRLSSSSFGSVYARTATAMRDLEVELTSPVMEKAFKVYYARWKFRHPSLADLRDVLAEVSGRPEAVDRAFGLHVWAAQKVDDRVESLKSEEELPLLGSTLTEDGRDEQVEAARKAWKQAHPDAKDAKDVKDGARPGPFPYRTTVVLRRRGAALPQTLVVKFADGSAETVSWDDGERWKRYSWVKPVKAVSAELDPQHLHLVDANRLDNSLSLKPERGAVRRLMADLGAVFQTFLALVATL